MRCNLIKYLFILLIVLHPFSSFAKDSQLEDIKKCIPFVDTMIDKDEMPKNPGDVVRLAETYCKKGSKMHISSIPNGWVEYVIYNVCDMKYTVHVEGFGTEEQPLASVVCLYEGKNIYGKY